MGIAERFRELVLNLAIANEGTAGPGVATVSMGAATAWPLNPQSHITSVGALLAAADAALYQAKSRGRNQVVVAAEK